MEITFHYTFADLFDINNLGLKTILKKKAAPLIIICLLVVASLGNASFRLTSLIGIIIIILAIIYLFPLIISSIRFIINKSGTKTTTLTITDIGLKMLTVNADISSQKIYNWIQLKDIAYNKKIVIIFLEKGVLAIPNRFFESDNQKIGFINKVRDKIHETNIEKYKFSTSKPPYWMGWLCLIPLIGAFIGVVLIINGFIKYKRNFKLILMGVGGIMFTFTIYYSLFRYSKSDSGRSQFISIAQSDLNTLMGLIEFYKIKHGEYPDRLNQLKSNSEFLSIYDPTQIGGSGKNANEYYYHNFGKKYQLFSFGLDGKPNTADDIYPSASLNDTSKIGLILKPPYNK